MNVIFKHEGTAVTEKKMRGENLDRLSTLPDCILVSILSLLKTKELVQTCILSKRWLNLWTFVPCLNFDGADFWEWDKETMFARFMDEEAVQIRKHAHDRFQNFVTNFLLHRDGASDVHTFRLCHRRDYDSDYSEMSSFTRNALVYALDHNPVILKVYFSENDLVNLPDILFTCQSLQNVDLGFSLTAGAVTIEPKIVRLPRLRKLQLTRANVCGDYLEKLLSGCPALECLKLWSCRLQMNSFSSQTLKQLLVMDAEFMSESVPPAFSISAPGVETLWFDVDMDNGIALTLKDMSKVTMAKIFTRNYDNARGYICDLLSGLPNVMDLDIASSYLKETLEGELPKCPWFQNLKDLTLARCCMGCDFDTWFSFMKHCPSLETLTLFHSEEDCQLKEGFLAPGALPGIHIREDESRDLEQIEGFPCKSLYLVEIMYSQLNCDCAVHELKQLIMQRTRDLEGVRIIFTKQ